MNKASSVRVRGFTELEEIISTGAPNDWFERAETLALRLIVDHNPAKMSEEGGGKNRSVASAAGDHSLHVPSNYYYGTFQGVANYPPQPAPPSHPVMGFPQPAPPPGFSGSLPQSYPHGYQTIPSNPTSLFCLRIY